MSTHNHYRALGVDRDASPEEIKRAFRREALRWHPDRNAGDREAERRFKAAKESYDVLRDPRSRRIHDRELDGAPVGLPSGSRGRGMGRGRGRCGRRCGGGRGRRWRSSVENLRDEFATVSVRLDEVEAAFGCVKTIVIDSSRGRYVMDVRLPAGLGDGDVLAFDAVGGSAGATGGIRMRVSVH